MGAEFELINCLFCDSKEKKTISSIGQFEIPTYVSICKKCGFVYLNPRWTKERYEHFYVNEYEKYYPRRSSTEIKDDKISRLVANRLATLNPQQKFQNVLDIGSGFGDILLYFKKNVASAANYYAIEPSRICSEFLIQNQIEVISSTVDNNWNDQVENKFDLIIMRHVLEHFLDPLLALEKVASSLTNNGIVYIGVPDAYHPLSPLNSYYFRAVHTSYFNKNTIQNFLLKAGLETLELKENLNGELYVIAKKGISKRISTPNVYQKQSRIIASVYNKEKRAVKFTVRLKRKLASLFQKIK